MDKFKNISDLKPGDEPDTVILKVSLKNKSPVKTWSNFKGSGKIIFFDLIDINSEIRVIAFNCDAVRLNDLLDCGNVYIIKNGIVKEAKYGNSTIEISFNASTTVKQCLDDENKIPKYHKFSSLEQISVMSKNTIIDAIGVCVKVEDVKTVETKNKESVELKNIVIADDSGVEMAVSMWKECANTFYGIEGDVIVIQKGLLSEFRNGKKININTNNQIVVNPPWDNAKKLQDWYNDTGKYEDRENLSQSLTFSQDTYEVSTSLRGDEQILSDIAEDRKKLEEEIKKLDSLEEDIKDKRIQILRRWRRLEIEEDVTQKRIKHQTM